jgi:biopolymer transport protein ExbD
VARKHHYKRRTKADAHEIDVTTFLNLMVVLVPFLLITAVFSRLTIVELDLPSAASGPNNTPDTFRVEVVVREEGIEISNGSAVIATIPKKEDEFDLETLSDFMVMLKRQYPSHDAASVLMEPQIPYDYLIQVMDVVRSVELLLTVRSRCSCTRCFPRFPLEMHREKFSPNKTHVTQPGENYEDEPDVPDGRVYHPRFLPAREFRLCRNPRGAKKRLVAGIQGRIETPRDRSHFR